VHARGLLLRLRWNQGVASSGAVDGDFTFRAIFCHTSHSRSLQNKTYPQNLPTWCHSGVTCHALRITKVSTADTCSHHTPHPPTHDHEASSCQAMRSHAQAMATVTTARFRMIPAAMVQHIRRSSWQVAELERGTRAAIAKLHTAKQTAPQQQLQTHTHTHLY
jgi:predicted transcriptional regulator